VSELRENRVGKRHKDSGSWASLAFGMLALVAFSICSACALAQENTAESWYKSGQELERTGAWQEAIDAYDQAIKLNPEYEEAWCAKCKALSNENLRLSGEGQDTTFDDAVNACNKAIEIDPKNARSWSGKGFVLSQEAMLTANKSEYNDSLLAYEKAIEVAGSDTSALSEAWRGKGTALSQMGRSGEALAAQEKAIELNESDVEAWMGKSMALPKLGRDDEAVQAYDRIFELYQSEDQRIFDYPYIWYSKGRVLEKLGRDEEAAHAYNKSIDDVDTIIDWVASGRDFYMNLSEAWQYKGQLLEEQGRYEEAVQALENATRINPESQRDWHRLGSILARDLGRYNQSLEAYDRALQLDPRDGDTLTGKANVLRSLGRYDEALVHYEKVLQHDMQSPYSFHYMAESWLGKGEILRMQGKYNESFLAYDKALELDPRYPEDVWIGRGRLLDSMGRHQESQKEYDQSFVSYREVSKNNSRRCDIWHGLGNALLGLNRYEEALKAYDNATRLNPNYAEAWFDKGLALLALNRDAEADAAFAIARKVGYSAEPQILRAPPVVTNVTSLGDDEFIELANNENVAQGFRNLRLIADGDENKSIVLPDFTLEPGQKIRIHFGQGESNQTDLYLGSEIDLNDTAGNLTLRDSIRGIEKGYMEYWTPPAQENSADDWHKKGLDLGRNGSYEEAVKAYDRGIELEPNNATFYTAIVPNLTTLAFIANNQSKRNESMKAIDKALQIDPGNPLAWEMKGEVLSQMEKYNESVDAYDKAIKNIGSYRQDIHANQTEFLSYIWTSKSISLWQMMRYNESLAAVDEAVRIDPAGNYDAWAFKGELLASLGRYNESLQAFDKSIELYEYNAPYAWTGKGDALLASGRYDEAIIAFDWALELYPKHADAGIARAQKGRGDSLNHQGKRDEALEAYGAAVEASDEAISAFNNATPFDRAISFTFDPYPLDQKFWIDRGSSLKALGCEDEAKDAYENALDSANKSLLQNPQDFNAHDAKGKILFELSRYDESIQVYDQFIKTDPGPEASATALVWKGKLLFEMGRANESLDSLNQAVEVDPQSAEAWRWKAGIAAELGRYEEALNAYNFALQLGGQPEDAEIWREKGGVLKALGRQGEADAAFAKAKELGYPK